MQPALDVSPADFALIAHQGRINDCHRKNAGPLWLHGLDAVHVALRTLTNRGLQIVAHTRVCKETCGEELPVGLALFGSTVRCASLVGNARDARAEREAGGLVTGGGRRDAPHSCSTGERERAIKAGTRSLLLNRRDTRRSNPAISAAK